MSSLAAARTQPCGLSAPRPNAAQCWECLVQCGIRSHILTFPSNRISLYLLKYTSYFIVLVLLQALLSQSQVSHSCFTLVSSASSTGMPGERVLSKANAAFTCSPETLLVCRETHHTQPSTHTVTSLCHLFAHLPVGPLRLLSFQASAPGHKASAWVLLCNRSPCLVDRRLKNRI